MQHADIMTWFIPHQRPHISDPLYWQMLGELKEHYNHDPEAIRLIDGVAEADSKARQERRQRTIISLKTGARASAPSRWSKPAPTHRGGFINCRRSFMFDDRLSSTGKNLLAKIVSMEQSKDLGYLDTFSKSLAALAHRCERQIRRIREDWVFCGYVREERLPNGVLRLHFTNQTMTPRPKPRPALTPIDPDKPLTRKASTNTNSGERTFSSPINQKKINKSGKKTYPQPQRVNREPTFGYQREREPSTVLDRGTAEDRQRRRDELQQALKTPAYLWREKGIVPDD